MKNNNKGFTLIELLAVIVILAILALIVSPIISGVIADAKKAAAARSTEGYVKAVEYAVVKNQYSTNGTIETDITKLSVESLRKDINPAAGDVTIDPESGMVISATIIVDGFRCTYAPGTATLCEPAKAWNLTNDVDGNGQADIGDEITVGTSTFYVISEKDADGNIKALAKYNLYVGGTYSEGNQSWTAYGTEATGLQDSTMIGYDPRLKGRKGITSFSSAVKKEQIIVIMMEV